MVVEPETINSIFLTLPRTLQVTEIIIENLKKQKLLAHSTEDKMTLAVEIEIEETNLINLKNLYEELKSKLA